MAISDCTRATRDASAAVRITLIATLCRDVRSNASRTSEKWPTPRRCSMSSYLSWTDTPSSARRSGTLTLNDERSILHHKHAGSSYARTRVTWGS